MIRGTRARRNVLLAGRPYRFWVDYWLFEEAGDNVDVVDPVEHHNGSASWNPPVPTRGDWQTRTIPRGQNPRVVLDCRRYAFLPRLKDLISNHRTMRDTLARHLSGLGLARTYLECLRRIVGFSFDDHVVLNPGHVRWDSAGRHYAQLGYALFQMDAYSRAYLIEQRTSQLIIWHLNRYARKIFHTLRHNRTFLQDIRDRELADRNSDEIRDIIAQAQLAVVNTPPPVSARDIPENETVYNVPAPRSAVSVAGLRPTIT